MMNLIVNDSKICNKCLLMKSENEFSKSGFIRKTSWCKNCKKEYNQKYYQENKEAVVNQQKIYRKNNKDKIAANNKSYYDLNKEWLLEDQKLYQKENRETINIQKNNYDHGRRENDIAYRLRRDTSRAIGDTLKRNSFSKDGQSIIQFLIPNYFNELKFHLERLFSHVDNLTVDGKIWMTWKNRGVYDSKTWDDNNPATWTWQIDHIIPHSTFKYTSMDCREFRDCWVLSNLRPLSAKQNFLDGVTRTRHRDIKNVRN